MAGETNLMTEPVRPVSEPPRLARPPAPVPLMPPPPTNAHWATWVPLNRWSRESRVGLLQRVASSPTPAYELLTRAGVLVLQANSLVARWDGLELHLGFEPQLIDGQPFVHRLDLKKNIEPLIHSVALPAKTNRIIVIDPGHGGQNAGATNVINGISEKEFTLDWARRLEPLLAAQGWQVFLTRTNDADIPLSDRVDFAEQHKADLFISLHFNSAAPNRTQSGLETFCLTPAGMASTLTREFPDDPSLVFTNNAFDAENLQFAIRIHRVLLQAGGMPDRGVRRARFLTVLRGQNRPAVLIEGGYLSNPGEARQICEPAYRQLLAEGVAKALLDKAEATASRPVPHPATVELALPVPGTNGESTR